LISRERDEESRKGRGREELSNVHPDPAFPFDHRTPLPFPFLPSLPYPSHPHNHHCTLHIHLHKTIHNLLLAESRLQKPSVGEERGQGVCELRRLKPRGSTSSSLLLTKGNEERQTHENYIPLHKNPFHLRNHWTYLRIRLRLKSKGRSKGRVVGRRERGRSWS